MKKELKGKALVERALQEELEIIFAGEEDVKVELSYGHSVLVSKRSSYAQRELTHSRINNSKYLLCHANSISVHLANPDSIPLIAGTIIHCVRHSRGKDCEWCPARRYKQDEG